MTSKIYIPIVIFLISFCVYFASTEHLIDTVRWPTGDEPYYLLITHSLVQDHDFELSNNFVRGDYLHFYPGELIPRHEAITPKPILVSKHSLGLPLLIAPAYALADWRGAAHMMNVFGALLAVNIFLLAFEVSGSRRVALAAWAALAFAPPLLTYAELIFPESAAALLIIYAYRHLRASAWAQSNRLQKFITLLCLAYLPWLHARFLFVVAGLVLWLAANVWNTERTHSAVRGTEGTQVNRKQQALETMKRLLPSARAVSACLLPSALLFIAYDLYVYASPLPNYADHAGSGVPAEIFAAFFGTFLDQQWGLLTHAPIYWLALVGLVYCRLQTADCRLKLENLQWLAVITLPYFLLVVQYRYWWGEWCPPARYLTPIVPLLAAPLAMSVAHVTTFRFRMIFAALSALGWAVALAFAIDARLMYNHPLGKSSLLVALGSQFNIDLTRLEPSFIMMFLKNFDPLTWIATQTALTVIWLMALSLIAVRAFSISLSRFRPLTFTGKFSIMRSTSPQKE